MVGRVKSEKTGTRLRKIIPTASLILACCFLSSCMDFNKTVRNGSNQTFTTLIQEIEIPGDVPSFPGISEWYGGNAPSVIENLGRNVHTGGTRYRLTWRVNVPPGGSVHIGWEFINSEIKFEDQGARLFSKAGGHYDVGALAVRTIASGSGRLAVEALASGSAVRLEK